MFKMYNHFFRRIKEGTNVTFNTPEASIFCFFQTSQAVYIVVTYTRLTMIFSNTTQTFEEYFLRGS